MNSEIDMKALRKRINWKQDRMARYLGVDPSTISRMERALKLKGPAIRLLQALAEAADADGADKGDRVEKLCPDLEAAA